jgi:hypothetical protein
LLITGLCGYYSDIRGNLLFKIALLAYFGDGYPLIGYEEGI